MLGLSALELARIQFGFTDSLPYHVSGHHHRAGELPRRAGRPVAVEEGRVYRDLYAFWSKIFAVNFAMGVVSGIVMAYQFGTNWSYFSSFAGGVTGPLLAYEVLTAFFLEAGFLGVMLFGWNKVGAGASHLRHRHGGAWARSISATWILASNSWMQTPARLRDRRRPRGSGRLAEGHLQSLLPISPRPYDARGLSRDRAVRRRLGRLAPAAGQRQRRRCAPCCRWRCGWCSSIAPIQIEAGDRRSQHAANISRPRSPRSKAIGSTSREKACR